MGRAKEFMEEGQEEDDEDAEVTEETQSTENRNSQNANESVDQSIMKLVNDEESFLMNRK